MQSSSQILRVVLQTPLRHWFDYLPPDNCDINSLVPGMRLRVPFGKRKENIGILLGITSKSEIDFNKLKKISSIIDRYPLYNQKHLELLEWVSNYYHHPIGEVVFSTLPALLRRGHSAAINHETRWKSVLSDQSLFNKLDNAPKQKALLVYISGFKDGVSSSVIGKKFIHYHASLKSLATKGLIESYKIEPQDCTDKVTVEDIELNTDQKSAVKTITSSSNKYNAFLLDGVTGSGKTEVYIQCIKYSIKSGQQALILLPEIGLTPQLIDRFKDKINAKIVVIHSALSDRERLNAWLQARDGEAQIILGTRSAVWVPLKNPGIIIVDEEHDLSYKQQDGFRYSARDISLIRGKSEKIPVVLGSATPSMESLQNVSTGRYQEILLPERAGKAAFPVIKILDIRGCQMHDALSRQLLDKISDVLDQKQQVLLFHNRRGYAPVMMCHDCGYIFQCPRCDMQVTYHKFRKKLCCHHCGFERNLDKYCPECSGKKVIAIGSGTERLTETLSEYFPQASVLRIDRDTTRRKGSMRSMLNTIQAGNADILIGTQMLAKGHHFPKVTLVGVIDADRGLFSPDFRASERMAQIIIQVSGRAGREEDAGSVIIQTHHPEHPLLVTLMHGDYGKFAKSILQERKQAELPPFSYHALLRAEANDMQSAIKFLKDAKSSLSAIDNKKVNLFGPLPAPIEKKAGRYRFQLLIQAKKRKNLGDVLHPWVPKVQKLTNARKVRWSLDIDPQDLM